MQDKKARPRHIIMPEPGLNLAELIRALFNEGHSPGLCKVISLDAVEVNTA